MDLLFTENFIKNYSNKNDYADNDKYCNHTRKHIFKIVNKGHGVKVAENAFSQIEIVKHNFYPLLHKEAKDKTACDNRRDLTRNVNTDRLHKQEVLRVFF